MEIPVVVVTGAVVDVGFESAFSTSEAVLFVLISNVVTDGVDLVAILVVAFGGRGGTVEATVTDEL